VKNSDFDYSYHYANWHSDTSESRTSDIVAIKGIFDAHNIYPSEKNERVLEIGCGMGRLLAMLQKRGYNDLTGIDVDKSQIEVAKRENLNVYLAEAGEFLENSPQKYNAIYCFDVLEHIEKEKQLPLFESINSKLMSGGFVVIRVPNALAPTASYHRYDDFTHNISHTANSLSFLLHNAGLHFSVIRPQYRESLLIQWLKMPWANLYRHELGINSLILTPNIMAIAFKDEERAREYLSKAPEISNNYRCGILYFAGLIVRGLRKMVKKNYDR
jgi:2-polyprenyl-3-methyl-5-hydroxy-6-metoxy-1,4-benzoquinol methylase